MPKLFKKHIDKRKRFTRVSLHIIFWICAVFYFAWGFGFEKNIWGGFIHALLFLPGAMIMTYTLLYFLTPAFLVKKKYLLFFIGLIILAGICSCYAVLANLGMGVVPKSFQSTTLDTGENILPFINVAGFAFSIKFLLNWRQQKQQTITAQNEQLKTELELLRAQVHPHFLFNTLNNLYSYTLEQSEHAPEIVLKLSHLMRFMIYESRASRISVAKEISLIQSYMELEQLRYGNRLDVSFVCKGDIGEKLVAPLLLLPFVENAYKHGASRQIGLCWISFNLTVDGDTMRFKLINSFDASETDNERASGGIGLHNARRRLELIYPDKHTLDIRAEEGVFIVSLELQLEQLAKNVTESDAHIAKSILYDLEMPGSR